MVSMPHKDPVERAAYHKAYMRRKLATDAGFRARHLVRVRRHDTAARERVRQIVEAFRARGCAVCGETDHACLDAHHCDPDSKDFSLGQAARAKISPERVAAELEKCACLCSNCHRKLHAGRLSLR